MAEHRFVNNLIHESSPYLLQHAHNPVNWLAWGDDAFEKAKQEDKPILVSIGYAACHWCHVMEHESFEDERTAEFMNKFFVNIKVDREERPDVDHIYMQACQIISGAGGWPLNMFLTPDLKPFTGGTYFPPKPYYGKPSWMDVLVYVHEVFTKERDKVEHQAEQLMQHVQQMDTALFQPVQLSETLTEILSQTEILSIHKNISAGFDSEDGGFGSAPKFPSAMIMLYLLKKNYFDKNEKVIHQIHLTLHKMLYGGIYDHVGGGFARYSVDKQWMIPHFEKMLYDNALLVKLFAEASMLYKEKEYKRIVNETLDFVMREMMTTDGAFYSSYDADSEGEEGKFYTWSKTEIEMLLGSDAEFFCKTFQVKENGNWEGTNILHRIVRYNSNGEFAQLSSLEKNKIRQCLDILFAEREKRVKPALDDKIILSWNALMCSAFVAAYKATGNETYKNISEKNLQFLLTAFRQTENEFHFFHTWKNGVAKYAAMLEDLAALLSALLDVCEITGNLDYLAQAVLLNSYIDEHFSDGNAIQYYFTPKHQADIPLRNKEVYDHATPSGNALQFYNLQKLAILTGNKSWQERADKMFLTLKKNIIAYPTSFGAWLVGSLQYAHPMLETVVSGKHAKELLTQILTVYHPNQIMITDETGVKTEYPLLTNRYIPTETLIYNCRNYNCHLPVKTLLEYRKQIESF